MSSRVCLIIYDLPVYISSCLFSLRSSGLLVIPGVSCLVLSCPALMSLLNIIIWVYILVRVFLFLPRVCNVTAAVLSVGCASFSSTLFPSTQLSVNMLGYSTLWTASFFANECLWLPSLWSVSTIVFWTTVRSAVFPMIMYPSEPNWETILKAQETFAGVLRWLADWHVTIFKFLEIVNWCFFVKCEPKSSQLKEPKT